MCVRGIGIGLLAGLVALNFGVAGWLVLLVAQARAAEPGGKKPGGLPPLVIDKSLTLEGPGKKVEQVKQDMADNSDCHVCHTNYKTEPFAVTHAKAKVGCVDCHGESFEHQNDEDNVTPPDIMYWPERVDRACKECHDTHDAPARKVLARWHERCSAQDDPEKIVCTDCHNEHRLKFRTVWWDRKTGKLVVRKDGQRTKKTDDQTKKR